MLLVADHILPQLNCQRGIVDEKIAKGGGPDIASVKKEQPEICQL